MAYAGHAAAALETTAALDESRDRNTTLSALLALGKVLAEESTRAEVAQRLADALPEIVHCDQADVLLWDAGDAVLARAASTGQPDSGPGTVPPHGPAGQRPGQPTSRDVERHERLGDIGTRLVVHLDGDRSHIGRSRTHYGPEHPLRRSRGGSRMRRTAGRCHTPRALSGVASLAATALEGLALLDEVRHQALHDPVTDLANSRLFEDRVTQALSIARRHWGRLALLFIDLDRFKAVNDTHGHKVGDELLRAVAERLRTTVHDEDTVARIGGDEFAILVQGASTAVTSRSSPPRWSRRWGSPSPCGI